MEKVPHTDPPRREELEASRDWLHEFLSSQVRPALEPALRRETERTASRPRVQLVGTGGTASILARMEANLDRFDRDAIEGLRLSRDRVAWHRDHLWNLSLADRHRVVGLPRTRADVILTGLAIYAAVMEEFGFEEVRVSTRGLRFAAVMEGG
jgi:exopolyphosphatase/guanosine-5'-triphosphate,3'-diphosphate pyrophosphatase